MARKGLAARVQTLEDIEAIKKLQRAYNYYVEHWQDKEDLLEISNKLTDGRGFNVCFEASGKAAIARQLILLAESGGTIVWAATYPPNLDVGVPISYVYSKSLSIHMVLPSPYSFPRAVQMLPKLNLKPLITVYPLQDAIKAFEAHKMGKDVKIMLQP